jgi:hypothetical protein
LAAIEGQWRDADCQRLAGSRLGAGQGLFCCGTRLAAFAEAGLLGGSAVPVGIERVGVTRAVAGELELSFLAVTPEFLGAFHAAVDLLHFRLDEHRCQRETGSAIVGVLHPRRVR